MFGDEMAHICYGWTGPESASSLALAEQSHRKQPHSLAHQISVMSYRIIDHDTSRLQGLWRLYTQTDGQPDHTKEVILATHLSAVFAKRADQEALQFILALVPEIAHHDQEAILLQLIESYLAHSASEQTLLWFLDTYSIAPLEDGSKIFDQRYSGRLGTILADHARSHLVTYQGARVFYLCNRSPDVILIMCDRELPIATACFRITTSLIYSSQIAFSSALGQFQMIRPGRLIPMTDDYHPVSERLADGSFSEPIWTPIPRVITDAQG